MEYIFQTALSRPSGVFFDWKYISPTQRLSPPSSNLQASASRIYRHNTQTMAHTVSFPKIELSTKCIGKLTYKYHQHLNAAQWLKGIALVSSICLNKFFHTYISLLLCTQSLVGINMLTVYYMLSEEF